METFYLQTAAGRIHVCRWLPEGKPVGIVQIIHGIAEYTMRYAPMAEYLTARGYVVVGEDHPGHGNSVWENDQFGYLTGGWMETVKLIHRVYSMTREEFPGVPYFMLGHSMGSFLLRTYLYTYHADLTGAVLSGTAWLPASAAKSALLLCKAEAKRLGERKSSPLLQSVAFGAYNRKFAPNRTPYDWVCTDEAVVDAYAEDPFCTWQPTIQLCREMMWGMHANVQKSNLLRMQKDLPVYFFAGQQDPVGNMGNGVLKAVEAFKEAGMQDVLVELYPNMRHECHNEPGKEKVFADLHRWMEEKAAKR